MSEPFLGEIRMAGFNFAPRGFALCNGQTLSIQQNAALFSILGTTYGGNGTTTFALPNLQGRVPMHFGSNGGNNAALGQVGGETAHTLITSELASHNHPVTAAKAPVADQRGPSGDLYGAPQSLGAAFSLYAGAPGTTFNPGVVGPAGSSQPHNNMQPYVVVTFYIALQGIFPSRN